jgi:hypothetical protein
MLDAEQLAQRVRQRAVVDRATGCWLWQGAVDRDGYAILWVRRGLRRRLCRVSHLALWLWGRHPRLRRGVVSHVCGNRRCFHPEHLAWHARRAQCPTTRPAGAQNGRAKLTEAEARRLLNEFQQHALTPQELAAVVGDKVKPATVEALLARRTWKHLPRPWAGPS